MCIEDAISFTLLVHTFAGTAGARSSITFIVSGAEKLGELDLSGRRHHKQQQFRSLGAG